MAQRLLLALCVLVSTYVTSRAQLEEVPLPVNPVLTRISPLPTPVNHPAGNPEGGLRQTATCVESGASVSLCADTTGLGGDAMVALITCFPLDYGTATLEGICLRYEALPGVLWGTDRVCLSVCTAGGECDTLEWTLTIHRPSVRTTEPITEMGGSDEIVLCTNPDPGLPTPVFRVIGPLVRQTGEVVTLAECFRYTTGRFGGKDTVLYEAMYDVCLSDTVAFPIRVTADTIGLPFFDDFSYSGPYPDPGKWLDDKAFVNARMAIDPPSTGVATLDGLDKHGYAYTQAVTERDLLTSAYLDLSPYTAGEEIILSFYAQPRGLGFKPDVTDSLILEFKDTAGIWQVVRGLPGLLFNMAQPFTYYAQAVPDVYRYKGFQFRFRNRSNLTGAQDHWHVDYVRLGVGQQAQPGNQDIAFASLPGYLIRRYTAMPWTHLRPDPLPWINEEIDIRLYNHFPDTAQADPSALIIRDKISGQVLLDQITLLELPPIAPINQRDLAPGPHSFLNTLSASDWVGELASFPDGKPGLALELEYSFEQDQEKIVNEPVALANNIVRNTTVLSTWYAYDDGTAESAIVAKKAGTQAAQQFESPVADTLRAVQFHFPLYQVDVTSQSFNLRVWTESLDSEPVYEEFFLRPFYAGTVLNDSLQAFTTYVLFDENGAPAGVPIPAGTFFIGWQQGSNVDDPIPVGFDKNHPDASDYSWQNLDGVWEPFPGSLRGALMIRPVFGPDTPTHTPDLAHSEDVVAMAGDLRLFPNPATSFLQLTTAAASRAEWRIFCTDATGRPVFDRNWTEWMDLSGMAEGLYFLGLKDREGRLLQVRSFSVIR